MSEPTGLGRRELVVIALYEDCEGIRWANARNDTRAEWRRIAQVALDASGDRSLLRAPTPSEFMKARARQLVMIARENAWTDEQLAGQILDEVYAVDGLRGTAPDRYPHGEGCPAILSRTGKCDCELIVSRPDVGTEDRALREAARALLDEEYPPSLIAFDRLRRVLRESVEGEQRT